MMLHPFHIHGTQFRILLRTAKRRMRIAQAGKIR
jgi:FtsP/CotA-like multicopper oxidase with cupredoxin domain